MNSGVFFIITSRQGFVKIVVPHNKTISLLNSRMKIKRLESRRNTRSSS